ncbi:MAG: hypothetical protein JW874_04135 [Spirochaetales bacterium]|nr:hypothetical protein [Spirochaetales bacterium]
MKDSLQRIISYIRFHLDLYILRNNLLFVLVLLLFMPLLLAGHWTLYAVVLLLLFRNWIIIRKYCQQVHDFPAYYISFPYSPYERLIGFSAVVQLIFPFICIIPVILFHLVFNLAGLTEYSVKPFFWAAMIGNIITWSGIMLFAALYWKNGQFRKLLSVIFAVCTVMVLAAFIFIRLKYGAYFSSLFVISDLAGFLQEIGGTAAGAEVKHTPSFFLAVIRLIYYGIIPLLMFRLSLRHLRRLEF